MGERRPGSRPERRVTMAEAAEILGTSKDAIRMRVRRGSLRSEKGADGRVYLFVEPDRDRVRDRVHPQDPQAEVEGSALVEELRDRVRYMEEQLREERQAHAEARRIIAGLVERVPPAIEPPASQGSEPRESPESPGPTEGPGEPERASERPWWRRMFGV